MLFNNLINSPIFEACLKITPQKKPSKISVIFNDPATILFIDDKKYISKAHKEAFDEEKGLLMCLAKANGYTHLDIQKMIKNAKRQTEKKTKEEIK